LVVKEVNIGYSNQLETKAQEKAAFLVIDGSEAVVAVETLYTASLHLQSATVRKGAILLQIVRETTYVGVAQRGQSFREVDDSGWVLRRS
jgi:hypothetical protein